MRTPFLLSLGMFVVGTAPAEGQKASHVPVVFVEGSRTVRGSLARRAAIDLRAALASRVAPDRLRVITTPEINNHLSTGEPDDFGQAWAWGDVRNAGWWYGADAIIDVTAVKEGGRITLRARRASPSRRARFVKQRTIVELSTVHASTLVEAVDILARRLAEDSVLVRAVGK